MIYNALAIFVMRSRTLAALSETPTLAFLASPLLPDLSLVSPGLTRATLVAGRPNKTFRSSWLFY